MAIGLVSPVSEALTLLVFRVILKPCSLSGWLVILLFFKNNGGIRYD
jgi:hypothetical protein